MVFHGLPDYIRLANTVLALVAAGVMMFGRYSPWRTPLSTGRFLVTSVAGMYAWTAYAQLEVILLDPVINDHDADDTLFDHPTDGFRAYGLCIWLIITLAALAVQYQRGKQAEIIVAAEVERLRLHREINMVLRGAVKQEEDAAQLYIDYIKEARVKMAAGGEAPLPPTDQVD